MGGVMKMDVDKLPWVKKSEKIASIEEVEFIIFRIQRLIQFDQQQHIIRTEISVDANEEVNLIDAN